jgi:hypothetical protein
VTKTLYYYAMKFITATDNFITEASNIKLFTAVIDVVPSYAIMIVTVSYFHHSLIFMDKAGTYLTGLHFKGRLLALPTNIRLWRQ